MAKNIVICCDGTNNQFGICNTNVVRIVQSIDRDPERQICYYDPGIGTLPHQGAMSEIGKRLSRMGALMFATDLHDKISVAYAHLMQYWEPGDQVFIFGFSRGAYTARVLAALLHAVGLMPRGNSQLLPYALRLFASLRQDSPREYWAVINSFRNAFARAMPGQEGSHFRVHFVGLWDTVSSIGWVWDPPTYPYTAKLPNVAIVRHAVSLDERRWFFRQNRVATEPGRDVQEVWFAGVHSDVGGGYPESLSGLWRVTFEWMLQEAIAAGLLIDEERLERVRSRSPVPTLPWAEPQQESLEKWWWLAEVVPKQVYTAATKRKRPALGLAGHRVLRAGDLIDSSALRRIRASEYAPESLSPHFIQKVKAMASIPTTLEYSP